MTAFTCSSGGIERWDSKTGGSVNATLDSYAISNGTTLLIDTDSHQCLNHSAAFGSLDTVTFTGIGGKVLVDGSSVRVIPYNTGSGNVPAIGATISQGGVGAVFLGVWASWLVEPTASGAAMPAAGYIKVRAKTGGDFAVGALTGVGASATGADVVGWIEIRGADTASITVPRIGAFEAAGDWFDLGTTTGARGQVIPCPTVATVAGVWPAIWVETSAGSGIYDRYAGAGSLPASATIPTDERGKIFWQTTGGIRLGSDGTNNVGYLPPTGCNVRIPNVIFTCCTRTAGGSGLRVLPNAALATRQEFITTAAGDIKLNGCVMQWYGNFLQAFRADVTNSAISDTLILQEIASPVNVDNVVVAPTQAQLNFALNQLSCFGGGVFSNTLLVRYSLAAAAAYVNTANYNKGVAYSNVKSQTLTNRANATTGAWTITQSVDCSWTNCTDIGGRMLHTGSQRPTITNLRYADNFSGASTATNPHYAVDCGTGTVGAKVDGVDFLGLANVHPYNGVVNFSACYDWTVRNIGTPAAPRDFGSANACGVIVNGAGNNDTGRIQSCHTINTRTGPWAFVNSDNNITVENVSGDYADATAIIALNTRVKAAKMAGSITGQTSVYGTHWSDFFTSATVGVIRVSCNEPTTATASQCQITAGTPRFNSAGQVAMTATGDQVTWEMPHFTKGHTSLANLAITRGGTNVTNLTYEFQCDKGAGYGGTWLTMDGTNFAAQGAIDPAAGVKLKIRATCATANAGNLLTYINVPTVTDATAQNTAYPLDANTVTFTGLPTGADMVVLEAGTTTILSQVDAYAGTSISYTYSGADTVDVGFIKAGFVPFYIRNLALTTSDASIPVTLTPDRNYF